MKYHNKTGTLIIKVMRDGSHAEFEMNGDISCYEAQALALAIPKQLVCTHNPPHNENIKVCMVFPEKITEDNATHMAHKKDLMYELSNPPFFDDKTN